MLDLRCGGEPQLGEFKKLHPHRVGSRAAREIDVFLSVLAIFGGGVHDALLVAV
jgi:hypothetical protein